MKIPNRRPLNLTHKNPKNIGLFSFCFFLLLVFCTQKRNTIFNQKSSFHSISELQGRVQQKKHLDKQTDIANSNSNSNSSGLGANSGGKNLLAAQVQVNLGGAGILPDWRGCVAPLEWSRSLSQVRDDWVYGLGQRKAVGRGGKSGKRHERRSGNFFG